MLPDYIIYDQLKREREKRRKERPRVEIEKRKPRWPGEPEFDGPEGEEEDEQSDRGVEIIQI